MIIAYTSSYIKMVMRTLGSLAIKIVTCNENSPYTLEFVEEKNCSNLLVIGAYPCIIMFQTWINMQRTFRFISCESCYIQWDNSYTLKFMKRILVKHLGCWSIPASTCFGCKLHALDSACLGWYKMESFDFGQFWLPANSSLRIKWEGK